MTMNWYITKIIFQIISGEGNHAAQFDEQLRLIAATDKEEAYQKACQLGQSEEDFFINNKGQVVKWQFINTSEIHLLNELSDGTEIYSHIEDKDNAKTFIDTINKKAEKFNSAVNATTCHSS